MPKHTVILSINRLHLGNMENIINTEKETFFFGKRRGGVRIKEINKMDYIKTKIVLNG